MLPRAKADEGRGVSTALESSRVAECQHVDQGRQVPDAPDANQRLGLGIPFLAQLLDLPVVGTDLLRQALDLGEEGLESRPQFLGQLIHLLVEARDPAR